MVLQANGGRYRHGQDEVLRLPDRDPIGWFTMPPVLGLRWLGLGPELRPSRALLKLQRLSIATFWARPTSATNVYGRQRRRGEPLARQAPGGFRPATSDGFSETVLWDIVVAGDLQGHGMTAG